MDDELKRRTAVINVRVLEEEKKAVSLEASVAGLTVSEYVRRLSLGRTVISSTDQRVLNELRRLGGLVKFVFTQGAPSDITADVLLDLQRYIKRLSDDR